MLMTTLKKPITKENLTEEALTYDDKNNLPRSIVFMKGVRFALKMIYPYVQDSFRSKIENLIK